MLYQLSFRLSICDLILVALLKIIGCILQLSSKYFFLFLLKQKTTYVLGTIRSALPWHMFLLRIKNDIDTFRLKKKDLSGGMLIGCHRLLFTQI